MLHSDSGNTTNPNNNPDFQSPTYRDWREERRQWRRERRESRHRFPFHGLFLGLTLLLLGTLFLLNQEGWISGDIWWQSLLIGLGVIFIINGLVCSHKPEYNRSGYGRFVTGTVLILIGTIFMFGFSQWWPVILLAAGIALLLRFLWQR